MTDRELFLSVLNKNLLNQSASEQMADYYIALKNINEHINLTAITSPEDAAEKHFNDSLSVLDYIPEGSKILDVGTGGGFPGVPIKIARPDVKMTLMDSVGKKIAAVRKICDEVSLNINTECIRAEEAKHLKNCFDVVLSRAVASLPILLELCIPLVKKGGLFIAFKQSDASDIKNTSAAAVLGAELTKTKQHNDKVLLVFTKTKNTPDIYPRRYALIKKNPL